MPWVSAELNSEFFDIQGQGSLAQTALVEDIAPYGPTTIASAGTYTTGIVVAAGYKVVATALTSSGSGNLLIQRYLDPAGTIPATTLLTTGIVAATPLVVIVNGTTDAIPFSSFSITISNTAGATITITKFYVLLQSY